MTGMEITKAEKLAAQLRADADKLDSLVKELKHEALRIADALLEAKKHGTTISLGLTDRADELHHEQARWSKHTDR